MKDKHIQAYMECAEAFAKCSVSTRLSVGSVIVKNNRIISCGYNALPEFLNGSLEDEFGKTLPETRHAEKSALMGLTKSNESAVGSVLFCTHACCKFCSIDIIDSGITKVYYRNDYRSTEGLDYLRANNVEVIKI
jgi:dCMP deaminase